MKIFNFPIFSTVLRIHFRYKILGGVELGKNYRNDKFLTISSCVPLKNFISHTSSINFPKFSRLFILPGTLQSNLYSA